MRAVAVLHNTLNPHTEIKMFHPYFEDVDDEDDNARYQRLQSELAAIGQEQIKEASRRGLEAHLAKKKVNG
jgi:hypothetical protein